MELYCIKTHSRKFVIKGIVYTPLNKKKKSCCGRTIYDVGVKTDSKFTLCVRCGVFYKSNYIGWVEDSLFANIDDINIEEAIECINELQTV